MARTRGRGRGRARASITARNLTTAVKIEAPQEEEPEERQFVRPGKISPHLFCVICSEVFNKPYRAPCGHSFCLNCIETWLSKGSCCPIDRKPVSMFQLHHDFILESIIGDYTVACPWRSSGCGYIGPLCQLTSHKKECVMNPDQLPEALRAREKENLKLQQLSSSNSLTNLIAMASTKPPVSTASTTTPTGDEPATASAVAAASTEPDQLVDPGPDLNLTAEDEDADDDLPSAPPPSLLMRLYQKSDADSRNLLCSFLSEPKSTSSSHQAAKRGRKRRRGDDDDDSDFRNHI